MFEADGTTGTDKQLLPPEQAKLIAPRQLAHLGDAVFALFEREREIMQSVNVKEMHEKVAHRSSAVVQANLLEKISPALTDVEKDIVRRARNIKAPSGKSGGQEHYRRATAFEALLGFLYLTSRQRLAHLLELTI